MIKAKNIELTLVHEFWCCKKELSNFLFYKNLLSTGDENNETKISCFTSYGNYLRHLYCFCEGIIKEKNKSLIKGLDKYQIGIRISELLTNEVKKLISNKLIVLTNGKYCDEPNVSEEFGSHLRLFRNWFSHVDNRRIEEPQIDLFQFYKKFHCFTLILFESADFSWSTKSNYDWYKIKDFSENIKSDH